VRRSPGLAIFVPPNFNSQETAVMLKVLCDATKMPFRG